jgi:hypothetical protein
MNHEGKKDLWNMATVKHQQFVVYATSHARRLALAATAGSGYKLR